MAEETGNKFDLDKELRRRMCQEKIDRLVIRRQYIQADQMEVDAQITRLQAEMSEIVGNQYYPMIPNLGYRP